MPTFLPGPHPFFFKGEKTVIPPQSIGAASSDGMASGIFKMKCDGAVEISESACLLQGKGSSNQTVQGEFRNSFAPETRLATRNAVHIKQSLLRKFTDLCSNPSIHRTICYRRGTFHCRCRPYSCNGSPCRLRILRNLAWGRMMTERQRRPGHRLFAPKSAPWPRITWSSLSLT